jgi:hypothetical protein
MQSIFDFIIKPKNKRYNNTKQIGDSELLLLFIIMFLEDGMM